MGGNNMTGKETGTTFTSASTNHHDEPNGPAGLPLMSDAGKKLASVSAPSNSYQIYKKSTDEKE
jgi:hypothetical protein